MTERVRIAVAHRGAGLSPVFAAVEGGYFAQQGLQAELIDVPGHPRALQALARGEADFINSVGPEVLVANSQLAAGGAVGPAAADGAAVIVASAISRSAQQVSARPGLASREQLRGLRWGVTARNDADECTIVMAFERWGWDPARDAQIVVVGSDRPRLDALLDEARVDVAIMHAPEPFQAAKRGWTLIEDLGRLDVAFQNSCAATRRQLLRERPDTVLRYVRAYCRGVYRFRTDAEFGIGVLRKYTGERDERVLEQTWVLFARLMGGMMFPSVEGLRTAAHVLHRLGVLARPPSPYEHLDLEPVAALERDGFFLEFMGRRES
ncbi:MAG TPA: ABC transporter substrate-binding protein [Burkholderiaceae bacterium]|nr:ABC transporter substrate-binding protein [Burkholderiaceae bacterium]